MGAQGYCACSLHDVHSRTAGSALTAKQDKCAANWFYDVCVLSFQIVETNGVPCLTSALHA